MALTYSIEEAVATITLDRPDKHNAFTDAMWSELSAACEAIASDDTVRVAVVRSAGGSFSTGGDFDEFAAMTSVAERHAFMRTVLAAFAAYERLPVPTIAAVGGLAMGGGCELAMVSDIVVAAESARFGLPEAKVGLFPGVAVARGAGRITRRLLDHMIYTGRTVDAAEARLGGLVTMVVRDDEFEDAVDALATDVARQAPLAVRAAKRHATALNAAGGYQAAYEDVPLLMTTADHAEGLAAFAERRPPTFGGS